MSCGQSPRRRHDGPHRIRWRLSRANGEAAAARDLSGSKRRPGNPPVFMTPSRGAWRCKRGRGRSLPGRADEPKRWQARRAAAAALDGKRKGVKGTSQHWLLLRPSRASEATDRPFQLSYPTPAPGASLRPRGAVDRASRWLARAFSMPVGSRPAQLPVSRFVSSRYSGVRADPPSTWTGHSKWALPHKPSSPHLPSSEGCLRK